MMKTYPCVLTIAGSDCSGGAGIQADIKTISALGAYAASAITAITVQDTCGVTGIHPVPAAFIAGQVEAVMTDLHPQAVKIGMIGGAEAACAVADALLRHRPPFVVLDPVMVSTSGRRLMDDGALQTLCQRLVPASTLLTPNLKEAEALTGLRIQTPQDMERAARDLLRLGGEAVLLKGGHLEGDEMCDVLLTASCPTPYIYTAPRIDSPNTHGTGCTLSSAIATFLALGHDLPEAVGRAKTYVHQAIEAGKDIHTGHGHGPLNHLFRPAALHIFEKKDLQAGKNH